MICNKCGKELARLKSKYCSEKCRNSYIASIRHTDLYKPKKNQKKIYSTTYFDWRDYPFGV
jgi:predicted amidophosphoribosyltransferase